MFRAIRRGSPTHGDGGSFAFPEFRESWTLGHGCRNRLLFRSDSGRNRGELKASCGPLHEWHSKNLGTGSALRSASPCRKFPRLFLPRPEGLRRADGPRRGRRPIARGICHRFLGSLDINSNMSIPHRPFWQEETDSIRGHFLRIKSHSHQELRIFSHRA